MPGSKLLNFAVPALQVLALLVVAPFAGCGYALQNSQNLLLEAEEVRRIYVAPVSNGSYKPGAETIVHNHLVRTILSHGKVRLVDRIEDSDAILSAAVGSAYYSPAGNAWTENLTPSGAAAPGFSTANMYTVNLSCSFYLTRRALTPVEAKELNERRAQIAGALPLRNTIWSGSLSASKSFPASQVAYYSTTSPWINESEFERSLSDLAQGMMEDLHESMLAMF